MAKTITKICSYCHSEDVTQDAIARWNPARQDWEIAALLDNADCDNCGGDTSLTEKAVPLSGYLTKPTLSERERFLADRLQMAEVMLTACCDYFRDSPHPDQKMRGERVRAVRDLIRADLKNINEPLAV